MVLKELLILCGGRRLFRERSTDIIDCGSNWYEEVGNFGFCISRREIERVAVALNYSHVAFHGLNDEYIEGVEDELASADSQLLQRIQQQIRLLDQQCKRGLSRSRPKLLVAIILKQQADTALRKALSDAEFQLLDLPKNPYLAKA